MTDEEFEVAKALTKLCKKKEMRLKQKSLNNQMTRKHDRKGGNFDPINTKLTMRIMRSLLDSDDYDHILVWTKDGKAFVIKDQDEFVRTILHNHLQGGKYSSFIRKLYRWGFQSILPNTYYNKNFQRCYYDRYSKLNGFENTFTQASPKKKVRFLEQARTTNSNDSEKTTYTVADSDRLPTIKQQDIRFPTTSRMSSKKIRACTKSRRRYYDGVVNHDSDSTPSPFVYVNNKAPRIATMPPSRRYIDIDSSSVISSSLRNNGLSCSHEQIMEDAMTVLINDRLKQKEVLRYKTELLRKQLLLRKQVDLEYRRMERTLTIQEWLSKKNESIFF